MDFIPEKAIVASRDFLAALALLPSAMTSSYARLSPAPSPRRPYCIAELADRATHNLWDPSKGLKQWLKAADSFRKAGRAYHEAGDLEAAFVEFAKAATIILEKLPSHKEYFTLLTSTQRHNLGLVSPQYAILDLIFSFRFCFALPWLGAVLWRRSCAPIVGS